MSTVAQMTMREKHLAIVLLDLIGSTAFVQKVGALKAAQWLQYHDRLTRNLIYRFNGREIDRSDGFMLSFDSVIDAVNFGLHYQSQIPAKIKLNTRIGIHWGKIIEVQQDDIFIDAGAKRVELEGIAKNIAARTMSLCQAGQVLLTKEAISIVRRRTNMFTPKGTRYACLGLYKFKGVKEPQEIYGVAVDINYLQPPPGSEKVKRIGGAKKIKSRARDRKLKEWLSWLYYRLFLISFVYMSYWFLPFIFSPTGRQMFNKHLFIIYFIYDLIKGAFKHVFL
jgi:class 3 adenylate cyclase